MSPSGETGDYIKESHKDRLSALELGGRPLADWDISFESSYLDSYFYMAWFEPNLWQSLLLLVSKWFRLELAQRVWDSLELSEAELDELTDKYQEFIFNEHFETQLTDLGEFEDIIN